jgi:hypothetical protein
MGTYKNKAYTLRIDNVLMDKIKTIATTEDRPISKQIERMLKDQVEQYEHEHGNIKINMLKNDGTIHNVNM